MRHELREGERGWVATLSVIAVPAICCALPLLVAALVATGAGPWLALHGHVLAVGVVAVSAGLVTALLVRVSRS